MLSHEKRDDIRYNFQITLNVKLETTTKIPDGTKKGT